MNTETMTQDEILRAGYDALFRELGSAGAVRFLQQLAPGQGDYTAERHQWLDGLTLEDILSKTSEPPADSDGEGAAPSEEPPGAW